MLVELSESSAEAMVVYQEPPGRRISLLFARYDLDGDENIDGPEAEAASSSWIPYALQGLEFRIAGETPERLSEEIKFRPEHNGALSAAIYLEWDVDDLDPGQSRAFTVSRKSDAADFETLVRFQLKSGLELTDAPSSRVTRETGPYRLPPGRSISVSATNTNTHDLPTRPP